MQLPDILDAFRLVKRRKTGGVTAFRCAIVDDRDARRHSTDNSRYRTIRIAVMGHQVDIGMAEQIVWTRESSQLRSGEISQIEERELAKADTNAERSRVFAFIRLRDRRSGTRGIPRS